MSDKIQNKMKMYRAVIAICDRHNRLTDSVPVFASRYEQFTSLVQHLEGLLKQREIDINGINSSRNEIRLRLSENTVALSLALSGYAGKTGDYRLTCEVRCSIGDLLNIRTGQMIAFAEKIITLCGTRLDRLWVYGVSTLLLKETEQLIKDLNRMIPAYTRARNARKTVTAQFSATIVQADNLLTDHLDRHARIIGGAWPIFYKLYRNSRRVYNPYMLRSSQLILSTNTAC